MKHALTSLVNSVCVTLLSSLAMTYKNTDTFTVGVWLTNWLVCWVIVFTYLYFVAYRVAEYIRANV